MGLLESYSWNDFSNLVIQKSKQYHHVAARRKRIQIDTQEAYQMLLNQPELQMALGESCKKNSLIQNVYYLPSSPQIEDENMALLFFLYERVAYLKNDADVICGFGLQGICKEGICMLETLKERGACNPYVSLFFRNKEIPQDNRSVNLYRMKGSGKEQRAEPFLSYLQNAAALAGVYTIPLSGYAPEEFFENSQLLELLTCVKETYVMFCQNSSVSAYLLQT